MNEITKKKGSMSKLVLKTARAIIIINGKGGVGKDTLISSLEKETSMRVCNISSIEPIRSKCREFIGENNEKTPQYRRLLSDLKKAYDRYYEDTKGISYSNEYLLSATERFLTFSYMSRVPSDAVLFVHIREPENITSYRREVNLRHPEINVATLLVESSRAKESYGNTSDDCVDQYEYGYRFNADGTEAENARNFSRLIYKILGKEPPMLINEGAIFVDASNINEITDQTVFVKVLSITPEGIKFQKGNTFGYSDICTSTLTAEKFAELYKPLSSLKQELKTLEGGV